MKVHNISIFAENSAVPKFEPLFGYERCITLHIRSGTSSPEITIFFDNHQEATNFKNAIIQSWETFLRETEKEKEKDSLNFNIG